MGVAGIYFRVGFLNLLFVLLNRGVFVRINEAGFKKEIPQGIQVNIIADIGIFIFGLMQHGNKFEVIANIHVQQRQSGFNPLLAVGIDHFFAKNNLGAAFNFVAIGKSQIKFV